MEGAEDVEGADDVLVVVVGVEEVTDRPGSVLRPLCPPPRLVMPPVDLTGLLPCPRLTVEGVGDDDG